MPKECPNFEKNMKRCTCTYPGCVNHAVPRQRQLAAEGLADHLRLEMHAVLALHVDPRAGQAGFDQGTDAVCVHRGGHRGA